MRLAGEVWAAGRGAEEQQVGRLAEGRKGGTAGGVAGGMTSDMEQHACTYCAPLCLFPPRSGLHDLIKPEWVRMFNEEELQVGDQSGGRLCYLLGWDAASAALLQGVALKLQGLAWHGAG